MYDANPFRTLENLTGLIKEKTKTSSATGGTAVVNNGPPPNSKEAAAKKREFEVPLTLVLFGYLNYTILFVISWIKELLYGLGPWRGKHIGMLKEGEFRAGYSPLYSTFESFYTRNVYRRIKECFNNALVLCSLHIFQIHLIHH